MPIGPSHGSRGGGSSFGGGGGRSRRSGGGSNLGGAILGGIIYGLFAGGRRRRNENQGGGENQLPYRPRPTKFLVFAIIFAVISVFTMIFRIGLGNTVKRYQEDIKTIETDYTDYYKPLIEKATVEGNDGCYKATANFGSSVYRTYNNNPTAIGAYLDFDRNGVSYYFIVYEYYDKVEREMVKGTTYSQFSANQIQNLNGKIQICYYSVEGEESYSINTGYTSYKTAEYDYKQDILNSNKSTANTFTIAFIVEIVLVALFVALFVVKLKKYKKLVAQDEELLLQKRQAETEKAQAEAQEAQIDAQRKNRFCQYCGSQIDEHTNTCTSCGARFSE